MKNRSVIHFGYEFDYSINSADKLTEPIPLLLKKYLKKFVAQGLMPSDFCPNQVTINCYQPGQGVMLYSYPKLFPILLIVICLYILR